MTRGACGIRGDAVNRNVLGGSSRPDAISRDRGELTQDEVLFYGVAWARPHCMCTPEPTACDTETAPAAVDAGGIVVAHATRTSSREHLQEHTPVQVSEALKQGTTVLLHS